MIRRNIHLGRFKKLKNEEENQILRQMLKAESVVGFTNLIDKALGVLKA
jgi:hypothetical protein